MSYSTISTQIKTLLDATTGIGQTYDYMKLSHNDQTNKSLYVTNEIFHVWFITRTDMPSEPYKLKHVNRKHNFQLIGFYAIDDSSESEKTFQALCDTICNEFDKDENINFVGTTHKIKPAFLENFEPVEFVNVLCHRAIITLEIEEELSQENF